MEICKMVGPWLVPFGWNFTDGADDEDSTYYKTLMNVMNVASYIPIIGSAVGAYRIWSHGNFLSADSTTMKIIGVAQILRGIVEFASGGLLFLIPDIIVSVLRAIPHYCATEKPVQVPARV